MGNVLRDNVCAIICEINEVAEKIEDLHLIFYEIEQLCHEMLHYPIVGLIKLLFINEYRKLPNIFKYFRTSQRPLLLSIGSFLSNMTNLRWMLCALISNDNSPSIIPAIKYDPNNRPPFVFKPELFAHYKEAFEDAALKDTNIKQVWTH